MNHEHHILCLAARPQLAPAAERELIARVHDHVDWELLWSQGHLHEVLPLLAANLRRLDGQIVVPADWKIRAQRRQYATLIRNTTLADAMVSVLAAFEHAGVRGIPVKGLVLAETLYGGLGLRSLGDLDVLVRPADLPAARAALRGLGFAQEADPGFDNLYHPFHDPPYYRPAAGGSVCLELHWGLWATRFFSLGTDVLWRRALSAQVHGTTITVLSPEDTLLHLAIHRSRSPLRLRFVCDIAALLGRHAATLDWAYVLEQARAAGARTALFYALALSAELLDAPAPAHVLAQLRVGALKRRLLEHTCGVSALFRPTTPDDLSQQPSLLLRLLEQDGIGHIGRNLGAALLRKGRKQIYQARRAARTSTAKSP
ncbi:MAG TPA: nucleotidyltransferase family protein [Kouleothrix sp.]|uniref:nucleotidyltransferase domain-containing protein n=1 Tax=Kouleothrix sp. TaxID=2779161 RepID=UPI002CD7FD2F|nr:nucleotidyltransferase family protein [Kouleothrix sp.]